MTAIKQLRGFLDQTEFDEIRDSLTEGSGGSGWRILLRWDSLKILLALQVRKCQELFVFKTSPYMQEQNNKKIDLPVLSN